MIGWYAHHQGGGHLTRMAAVAEHLRTPVWGLSSAPAPAGWDGPWLQLARDDQPPVSGPRDAASTTANGVLHWAPARHPGLADRGAQIAGWAARHRPRLLVVDVSVEVALLGRLCGTPTVVVALPGHRDDRPHLAAYDSADALLAPWPPEAHAQDWPQDWLAKSWFVGGLSRFDGRPPPPTPGPRRPRRTVLLLWGSGGDPVDCARLAAACAATPDWRWEVLDPAEPATPDVWSALTKADVVVCHGGQNAVAEVASARRPAVIVAQPRPYDEQVATASALDRLGVATGLLGWPDAAAWPGLLERALERGGSGWKRWSTGRAARDAAEHIDALAAAGWTS